MPQEQSIEDSNMNFLKFLFPKSKTDLELQAELKAVVKRIIAEQDVSIYSADKYDTLLPLKREVSKKI